MSKHYRFSNIPLIGSLIVPVCSFSRSKSRAKHKLLFTFGKHYIRIVTAS